MAFKALPEPATSFSFSLYLFNLSPASCQFPNSHTVSHLHTFISGNPSSWNTLCPFGWRGENDTLNIPKIALMFKGALPRFTQTVCEARETDWWQQWHSITWVLSLKNFIQNPIPKCYICVLSLCDSVLNVSEPGWNYAFPLTCHHLNFNSIAKPSPHIALGLLPNDLALKVDLPPDSFHQSLCNFLGKQISSSPWNHIMEC